MNWTEDWDVYHYASKSDQYSDINVLSLNISVRKSQRNIEKNMKKEYHQMQPLRVAATQQKTCSNINNAKVCAPNLNTA